eukprot:GHVT01105094.1.p1 GENE.GHVT01105094.1~~GHVT01105094.1.p1  ORF type:complete len:425 (-),score=44.64 GHVT01105094.1:1020-2294(-)
MMSFKRRQAAAKPAAGKSMAKTAGANEVAGLRAGAGAPVLPTKRSMSLTRRRLSVVNSSLTFEADGASSNASSSNNDALDGVQDALQSLSIRPAAAPSCKGSNIRCKFGRQAPSASRALAPSSTVNCNGIVASFSAKSKKGVVPMNTNKVNQDTHEQIATFANLPNSYWFSVMDGHGVHGHIVSGFVRDRLSKTVKDDRSFSGNASSSETVEVLRRAFRCVNNEVFSGSNSRVDVEFSGTTCVTVLIRGNTLYCANVGDSRAICAQWKSAGGWNALPLSNDHKPDDPVEQKRINDAGGRVDTFRTSQGAPLGPARVWLRETDVPGLAMSRSIGDGVAASVGVSAEAEVQTFQLGEADKFLVIASDGVWEFLSNEEVIDIVRPFHTSGDVHGACEALVHAANQRWVQEEDVIDDTTCVIVFLNAQ